MAADPRIRASDDDRDRAASLLREHHAVGRLTPEEFSERLDKVYEAKTVGELEELMADLPGIDLYRLPDASMPRYRASAPGGSSYLPAPRTPGGLARGSGRFSPGWQAAWGSWLSVSLVCFVIWAISGGGYLWPLWVVGPWGAVTLGRWITGSGGPSDRGQLRGRRGDHDELGGNAPNP
jgi:Domain of unknown function (DUF1707)